MPEFSSISLGFFFPGMESGEGGLNGDRVLDVIYNQGHIREKGLMEREGLTELLHKSLTKLCFFILVFFSAWKYRTLFNHSCS